MVTIRFKAKIRRSGDVSLITIPKQYIKDGILWQDDEFDIIVDTLGK